MASSRSTQNLSMTLAAIATLLLHVALGASQRQWWPVAIDIAIAFALVAVIWRVSRDSTKVMMRSPPGVLLLMLLASAPIFLNAIFACFACGEPWEVLLAYSLRNTTWGLVVIKTPAVYSRWAALGSCFLALFSFMTLLNTLTSLLVVAFAIVSLIWLMATAWDRVAYKLPARSQQVVPRLAMSSAMLFVILIALAFAACVGTSRTTTALAGFMPSSGGSGEFSPVARGGVNDGDQLVGGQQDASSFGAVETELFLESEMPSLYDMYSESYQEPAKREKRQGRAISLPGDTKQREHRHRAHSEQASREFSTVRQATNTPRERLADLRSHALAFVGGRTPLHLKLETYDCWDGTVLSCAPQEEARQKVQVREREGRSWLEWGQKHDSSLFPQSSVHELKIVNLKSDRILSPPNLEGVHLYGVTEPSAFAWTNDNVLRFDAPFIPQLSVLHVRSAQTHPDLLTRATFARTTLETTDDALDELVRQWTHGTTVGWPQISAVCQHLRDNYQLDAQAVVPTTSEDSLQHFLLISQRGPDYLFATSAAALLRRLGYRTRVASGFYASPINYDRQSQCTGIYLDSVHFWAEIMLADGSWITLEPSPGYDILYCRPSLTQWCVARLLSTWSWLTQHWLLSLTMTALCVLAARTWRRWWLCCLVAVWWFMLPVRNTPSQVRATIWLLQWQGYLGGFPRQPGQSLETWLAAQHAPTSANTLAAFSRLSQRVLYSRAVLNELSDREATRICQATAWYCFSTGKHHENSRGPQAICG